ncbi:MAG: hypothetical protein U0586_03390 [Candidatus Brocadiaceae bacterium]
MKLNRYDIFSAATLQPNEGWKIASEKTLAMHFAIAKRNPAIAPLFCHCERSEAIFLS